MFGVLQLSDIHFAYERDSAVDVDRELRDALLAFLPQLTARMGSIDLIVVCGDVAYHGLEREYETAEGFLRALRSRLDTPTMPVRVIPGNHDIFRDATESADQDNLRSSVRRNGMDADARNAELIKMLSDATQGAALMEPLAQYNQFAASFECAVSSAQPYWDHRFALDDHWVLRLRGMNSVLVSNAMDDRDRLVVGANLQCAGWRKDRPGEVNVSLCHHPYCWLLDGQDLRRRVCKRSHLHVTGHVHRHELDDSEPGHIRLMGGALQPPRHEHADPRFNGLTFAIRGSIERPRLELGVVAVRWDEEEDSFVFDEPNCGQFPINLKPRPAQPPPLLAPDDPDIGWLTERLSGLQAAYRFDAAKVAGLSVGEVQVLPEHERVGAIVEKARISQRLSELWDEVARLHGKQTGVANPFRERGL